MNILINHCWCSDSNWGGNYDCRVIVSIKRILEGKNYHDTPSEDWTNLLEEYAFSPAADESMFRERVVSRFKPEIIKWLSENVKDRKCSGHKSGWCIGTDKYNSKDPLSFLVFFERQMDAINYQMTKDHWVCRTLSHDWLVDIACLSSHKTRKGVVITTYRQISYITNY